MFDSTLAILKPFLPNEEQSTNLFFTLKNTVYNLRICTEQQKFVLDSFLDFSKLEAGKLVLSKTILNISNICHDAINMMQYLAHHKKLELKVEIPEIPYLVKGDPFRLKQILLNLVSNAIKFTQEGRVTVQLTEEQNTLTHLYLKIRVSDTGIGMDNQEQQRIFQPYTQANASISPQYGGTGLGLFITKSLVEKMKGRINVTSEKGKGSEFCCIIRCKKLNRVLSKLAITKKRG